MKKCFSEPRWRGISYMGKYELRPAIKKLYQLRPKVSSSRVSVASRFVNPKHDKLRPAGSKELCQLHRKIWVYKMSNNWKVLTVLLYFTLYTIICAHTELLNDIDNTVVISCYCLMFKLRWSRGSVLAFSTQVRAFKPGRSRRIFRAKKPSARLPSEGK